METTKKQEGGNHYKDLVIQPIEFILANDIPHCEACVIKYITRWKTKNGIEYLRAHMAGFAVPKSNHSSYT